MQDRNEQDEQEARRLLAPLAAAEEPGPPDPAAVDVRRAMADGRRRLRHRRVAGVGAVAAAAGLAVAGVPVALDAAGGGLSDPPPVVVSPERGSPTVAASPVPPALAACQVERLPVSEHVYQSLVTGGDPSGRYLLGRIYSNAGRDGSNLVSGVRVESVIWDHGEPTVVEIPGYDGSLTDINSSGVAIGSSFESDQDLDSQVTWVYQDGELHQLPGGISAASINEQGAIAGSRAVEGDSMHRAPVVWHAPDAEPERLSVPGETWNVGAADVDADGTVVGSGYDVDERPDAPSHAFVWLPDGTRQRLPQPDVAHGTATGFSVESIDDGVITGRVEVLPDEPPRLDLPDDFDPDEFAYTELRLYQYDLRTGSFTRLAAEPPVAEANAQGWSVGSDRDGWWLVSPSGDRVSLPDALPDVPEPEREFPWDMVVASISADGRVLGGQLRSERELPADGGETRHAFAAVTWRCD